MSSYQIGYYILTTGIHNGYFSGMELRQYLDQHDLTIADFARLINVSSRMTVFRYLNRKRIPAPGVMERIVAETGGEVQPNDFYGSQGSEVRDQKSGIRDQEGSENEQIAL